MNGFMPHMGMGMGMRPPLSMPSEPAMGCGMPTGAEPPQTKPEAQPPQGDGAQPKRHPPPPPPMPKEKGESFDPMMMNASAHPHFHPMMMMMMPPPGQKPGVGPFGPHMMFPGAMPHAPFAAGMPPFAAGQAPAVPRKNRFRWISEPTLESKEKTEEKDAEAFIDTRQVPEPSCPCLEKKVESSSGDEEEKEEEKKCVESSEDSSSAEERCMDSSSSSSDEEDDSDDSSDDERPKNELLYPPEVLMWCRYQMRKKYFRRMCKAYTVWYTRMTMMSEYYNLFRSPYYFYQNPYMAPQYYYPMMAPGYYPQTPFPMGHSHGSRK